MITLGDQCVGRVAVEVDLANSEDMVRAKDGAIPSEEVRRVHVPGTRTREPRT